MVVYKPGIQETKAGESFEFRTGLGYILRPFLKTKQNKKSSHPNKQKVNNEYFNLKTHI